MEVYHGKIAVTFGELTGGATPIVKAGTLRTWLCRGKAHYLRKAYGQGVEALVEYSTLPVCVKKIVCERYGDPEPLKMRKDCGFELPADPVALQYYKYEYRYIKGGKETGLSENLVDEYTLNARICRALMRRYKELIAMGNRMKNARTDVWSLVQKYSEELSSIWGHTLPTSTSRLRAKVLAVDNNNYRALINNRCGNTSAAVLVGEAAEYVVSLKRSQQPRYSNSQILDEYNRTCASYGWKPLRSLGSLTSYLYRPEVRMLWVGAVLGEHAAHAEYGYKLRTQMPTKRDAMWAADGTRLNLYYKIVGEDGRQRLATVDVYVIIDVYSGMMLAYEIGDEGKSEVQYRAFRKALLYAEHRPYELVLDNQAGQRKLESQGFLSRVAHHVHFKTPYRAQANPIEAVFGQFQSQVLHRYFFFTGKNITAKGAESRPNLEYIQANIDAVPTYEELLNIYAEATDMWNRSAHPTSGVSRYDMYHGSFNEELVRCTQEDYVEAFWLEASRPVTFRSSGLEMTIGGRKHVYEVYSDDGLFDHEWRAQWLGYKFIVRYDPCDTRQICLYSIDKNGEKRFCTYAHEAKVVQRALQERKAIDEKVIYGSLYKDKEARKERIIAGRAIDYKWGNKGVQPRVPGMTAEENAAIDAEARRRAGSIEHLAISRARKIVLEYAQVAKAVSVADWSEALDPSKNEELLKRVYDKM